MKRNMFGFPAKLYQEGRRKFRIRENLAVNLSSEISTFFGSGRIKDISSTGALLEAKALRPIGNGTVLGLRLERESKDNFLPSQGRVVWSKEKGFFNHSLLCGIEFVNPSAEDLTGLKTRVQSRIVSIQRMDNFKDIVNIALFLILVVLGFIVLRQQVGVHRTIEKSNHLMMGAATNQAGLLRFSREQYTIQAEVLTELNNEYNATRVILAQTESLLARTQVENQQTQEEISGLKIELSKAQTANLNEQAVSLLKERDILRQELAALKTEMNAAISQDPEVWRNNSAAYQSRVDDAQLKMTDLKYSTLMARIFDHKKGIGLAKQRIHELKRQAASARREVQRQKDQIELAQGNRGYIIRDGESVNSASAAPNVGPKVNIDVSFFE
ncbi:MAG: PilZ domain-containing protein [Candidatus Aceula meridiana]|nr:PilZ domain-containing protein [Candidatus Aceula meridiana]